MYRLFYVSTAEPGTTGAVADAIARDAMARNEQMGVTGALAFNGVNFAQIIEGEERVVGSLMNAIKADPRHTGVIVVDQKPVCQRAYCNWSMKRIEDNSFEEFLACMVG